jgi:hypothetical protein
MSRTRIIIGHPAKTGSALPHLVYLGTSGSEAEAAMKADQSAHHYEIFEGPGRRKNNATFNPAAFLIDSETGKLQAVLIPVQIGEGEDLVVINVSTEEEAEFLRGFSNAAKANCNEIIRIQQAWADQVRAYEIAKVASLEELEKNRGLVLEIGEQLAVAKNEASISKVTLEARDLELESCKAEVLKRDARIAELEAQMTAASKDPAPSPAPASPPASAKKK